VRSSLYQKVIFTLLEEDILLPNNDSKRTLTSLYKSLEELGIDTERIKERVYDVVKKTVIALEPFITQEYYSAFGQKQPNKSFQILGFDILIDRHCKAWLLEINANPSLNIKNAEEEQGISPVDNFVKTVIVEDALKIIITKKTKSYGCYQQLLPIEPDSTYSKFNVLKKVIEVFMRLQGVKNCGNINLFKFSQLMRFIPSKVLTIERYEYSLVYTQVMKQRHDMDLGLFMDALEVLAEKIFGKNGDKSERLFKLLNAIQLK